MKKYDPELIKKISQKTGSTPKSVREQISRRALRHNVSEEAELANWARLEKISATSYIRKLPPDVKAQIFSQPTPNHSNSFQQPILRIVRIGKKEDEWYNLWWVQPLVAFFVVGILASTISQILGTYFTNLIGLNKP